LVVPTRGKVVPASHDLDLPLAFHRVSQRIAPPRRPTDRPSAASNPPQAIAGVAEHNASRRDGGSITGLLASCIVLILIEAPSCAYSTRSRLDA
jgi:hypothetical protein